MAQIQSIDVLCKPSVYLLFDQGVLVYVGQSKTPSSRVLQHRKDKIFDSFKYCGADQVVGCTGKIG